MRVTPCADNLVIETHNVVLDADHADFLPELKLEFVQLSETGPDACFAVLMVAASGWQ